jgi:hypothetical protein
MILFYAANGHQMKDSIPRLMVEHQFNQPVMPFDSLEALEVRLRRPHLDVDIILICVGDAIEMVKLTQMRSLLIDKRIVMVLPRREPDMVAWAHKLGPRFIAYADTSENQVAGVLGKMLNKPTGPRNLLDFTHLRQKQV